MRLSSSSVTSRCKSRLAKASVGLIRSARPHAKAWRPAFSVTPPRLNSAKASRTSASIWPSPRGLVAAQPSPTTAKSGVISIRPLARASTLTGHFASEDCRSPLQTSMLTARSPVAWAAAGLASTDASKFHALQAASHAMPVSNTPSKRGPALIGSALRGQHRLPRPPYRPRTR